jgi:hypothetical protein
MLFIYILFNDPVRISDYRRIRFGAVILPASWGFLAGIIRRPLKMKATCSEQTTRRYITGDRMLHNLCCGNLKPYNPY